MNVNVFVPLVCVMSMVIGGFLGIQIFKSYNRKNNKKIEENAKEVLEGTRDNKIIIDGQEYDATKFVLKNKDDEEILIDLKGGGEVQNGRRKEREAPEQEIPEQAVEAPREVSSSIGKEKRTTGRRPINSRLRKFS